MRAGPTARALAACLLIKVRREWLHREHEHVQPKVKLEAVEQEWRVDALLHDGVRVRAQAVGASGQVDSRAL